MYLALLNGLFLLQLSLRGNVRLSNRVYWVVLIGLFLFSAFRFRVGCDWSGYYVNFTVGESYDYATVFQTREPLWWMIQGAFNSWDLPYPTVNILTSAIFFVGVHALGSRQPDRLAFLVLLFPILIINMPMSGIRQGASVGFLCLSFVAFLDKRPLRFIIWILIGSAIHSSILAFLLLTPLTTGRYTKGRVILTLLLGIPGVLYLISSDVAQLAFDRYVDTGIDAFGAAFRVGILTVSGLFFFWYLRKTWFRQFPQDAGLATIGALMMIMLLPLLALSTVISDRMAYYLIPIQSMIFARIPFLQIGVNGRLFSVLPYIGLGLVFIVWSTLSYHFQICYLPYQSWLFGHVDFKSIGF